MEFCKGDFVWVKITRCPWWPAQVIAPEDYPFDISPRKRKIVACVKFVNENVFEVITDQKVIQRLDCRDGKSLAQKGLTVKRFSEDFKAAVQEAETESGLTLLESEIQESPLSESTVHKESVVLTKIIKPKKKRKTEVNAKKQKHSNYPQKKVKRKITNKRQKCFTEETPSRKVSSKVLPNLETDSPPDTGGNEQVVKSEHSRLSVEKTNCIKSSDSCEKSDLDPSDYGSSPGLVLSPLKSRGEDSTCSFDIHASTPANGSDYRMEFCKGDFVWVKVKGYPWWPAEVIASEDCPTDRSEKKRKIVACVKFVKENCFEVITDQRAIQRLDCKDRKSLAQKGSAVKGFSEDFKAAVREAESLSGLNLLESEIHESSENTVEIQNVVLTNIVKQKKKTAVHAKKRKHSNYVQKKITSKRQKCSTEETPSRKVSAKVLPNFETDGPPESAGGEQVVKSEKRLSFKKTNGRKSSDACQKMGSDLDCTGARSHSSQVEESLYTSDYGSSPGHALSPLTSLNDSTCSFDLPTPTPAFGNISRLSFDPNLSKDSCDSSDSDVELPDGLSPSVGGPPVVEKDIIFLRWRTSPFWPAYVKKVYNKKQKPWKFSVIFINPMENTPVMKITTRYKRSVVLPFSGREKSKIVDRLQEESRAQFTGACDLADDYLNKKVLGLWKKGIPGLPDTYESNSEDGKLDFDDYGLPGSDNTSECSSSNGGTQDLLSDDSSPKEQERYEKIKVRYQKLVDYITSEEMKKYLVDILRGKRKSDRHQKFSSSRTKEKSSLKYAGFGPIADEQQQEEIITTLIHWYTEECAMRADELPDYDYVMDVWIPEAVIQGLVKAKGCHRAKATERFFKGVKLTKREHKKLHESILKSAKNISTEDWSNHEEKRRIQMKDLGLDIPLRAKKVIRFSHLTTIPLTNNTS